MLDHGAVDFGRLALDDELDLLAGRDLDLAHQARHALEHRLHRLRADRHDAVLDLARQVIEFVERKLDLDRRDSARPVLCQHRLVDHEFADEIDEPLDAFELDANRFGGPPPAGWRAHRLHGFGRGTKRRTAVLRRERNDLGARVNFDISRTRIRVRRIRKSRERRLRRALNAARCSTTNRLLRHPDPAAAECRRRSA